ncbi:MAG TPA: TIGR02588 family protein, partial [Blastocatellia bacterium]|nr:TIGR02588 family protein [Blastocatellia bacterium]
MDDKADVDGDRPDQHWKNAGDKGAKPEGPPLAEWVVAAFGLLLVGGTIGFLLYQAVAGGTSPPDIVVEMDSISPVSGGYLVTVRVINQGESTAEGVVIEGTLRQGENSLEKAQTTLDYIASQSETRGGLFFTKDPRQFQLQLQALGYEQP